MRQYISRKELDENGYLTVIGKDYRYMRQVLRLKTGDMVNVRFPDGALYGMTVCRIEEDSRKIIMQVCASSEVEKSENLPEYGEGELNTEFWLFMFVPKSSKLDLIIRQATECGVSKIIPVSSDFSQKGSEKMNFRGDRFERIIKEARQQSGSPVNTVVEDCISVQNVCEMWKEEVLSKQADNLASVGCVLYERTDFSRKVSEVLNEKTANGTKRIGTCAVVCGAEGGISLEEIKLLCGAGFDAVHFKTNILRCETAALYGIAAVQNAVTERYSDDK